MFLTREANKMAELNGHLDDSLIIDILGTVEMKFYQTNDLQFREESEQTESEEEEESSFVKICKLQSENVMRRISTVAPGALALLN